MGRGASFLFGAPEAKGLSDVPENFGVDPQFIVAIGNMAKVKLAVAIGLFGEGTVGLALLSQLNTCIWNCHSSKVLYLSACLTHFETLACNTRHCRGASPGQ